MRILHVTFIEEATYQLTRMALNEIAALCNCTGAEAVYIAATHTAKHLQHDPKNFLATLHSDN